MPETTTSTSSTCTISTTGWDGVFSYTPTYIQSTSSGSSYDNYRGNYSYGLEIRGGLGNSVLAQIRSRDYDCAQSVSAVINDSFYDAWRQTFDRDLEYIKDLNLLSGFGIQPQRKNKSEDLEMSEELEEFINEL